MADINDFKVLKISALKCMTILERESLQGK